ncbi:MAG: winged helix-turn-helix transcriptional regulator [Candidatus Bathyarchaeota archaeon]|nr:MAG: winged helix-turn-helix transcriptional regulator [Candidatus Bathyarchaeota archaeon]
MATEEDVIESELKGKTLLVYMYILRANKSSVGVREVQRALGFSSPSVSAYHLNKLQELGLVESIRGDYNLIREVKVGVLKQFVTFGGVMLPRYLFYAVLVTTMLITYLIQFPFAPTRQSITTIILGIVPSIILWYETVKLWREKPG